MSEPVTGDLPLAPPPDSGVISTVRRVARNAAWLLASQGSARLIGFAFGTALARLLGAEGFGTYMFVMTYVSYFGYLADAGLGRYLIRDVARDRAATLTYLGQITTLRLALAVAAYALLLAMAVASGGARSMYVAVAGVGIFTGAVAGAFASVFTAREEMHIAAVFGILSSACTATFALAAVALGGGLAGTFVAVSAANLPPLAFLLWAWRSRGPYPRVGFDLRFWGHALRDSYAYALLGLVGLVYFRIDALMLTWLKGPEATGIYTAAYRLLDAVTDAPGVIVAAIFPTLARLHRGPRPRLRRAYRSVMVVLTLAGLPVAAALALLAGPVTNALYGAEFAESATVLRLLAVAVFLIFVDTANTMMLYSGDNMGTVLALSLATTAANIGMNLLLIPRYSYNGAAAATIASTALSLLIFTPLVLRYLRSEPASSS